MRRCATALPTMPCTIPCTMPCTMRCGAVRWGAMRCRATYRAAGGGATYHAVRGGVRQRSSLLGLRMEPSRALTTTSVVTGSLSLREAMRMT